MISTVPLASATSTSQRPNLVVIPLNSTDVLLAIQALVKWQENNPNHSVPPAEDMGKMLDNFANPPPPPPPPPESPPRPGWTFRAPSPSDPVSDSEDSEASISHHKCSCLTKISAPKTSPRPKTPVPPRPLSYTGKADKHLPMQF